MRLASELHHAMVELVVSDSAANCYVKGIMTCASGWKLLCFFSRGPTWADKIKLPEAGTMH